MAKRVTSSEVKSLIKEELYLQKLLLEYDQKLVASFDDEYIKLDAIFQSLPSEELKKGWNSFKTAAKNAITASKSDKKDDKEASIRNIIQLKSLSKLMVGLSKQWKTIKGKIKANGKDSAYNEIIGAAKRIVDENVNISDEVMQIIDLDNSKDVQKILSQLGKEESDYKNRADIFSQIKNFFKAAAPATSSFPNTLTPKIIAREFAKILNPPQKKAIETPTPSTPKPTTPPPVPGTPPATPKA